MPLETPKRRLSRMLRRSAKRLPTSKAARVAVEENAFWLSHGRAVARVQDARRSAQTIATVVAKQRAAVDGAADRTRAAAQRAQELAASFARVGEVFDRLGIVALNAGLEGARLGETAGRAVLLVSDEVRSHTLRGTESVRELAASLGEMASDLAQLVQAIEPSREAASEIAAQAAVAAGATAEAERALSEVEARIRTTTGSDPETARAIAEANEHASALVRALGEAGARVPQEVLLEAVRPMLEPLLGLIAEDDDGTDAPEDAEGGADET